MGNPSWILKGGRVLEREMIGDFGRSFGRECSQSASSLLCGFTKKKTSADHACSPSRHGSGRHGPDPVAFDGPRALGPWIGLGAQINKDPKQRHEDPLFFI